MSQPPVSRVNLQGTCVTLAITCKVGCSRGLVVHHLLTAAPCPLPLVPLWARRASGLLMQNQNKRTVRPEILLF